MTHEPTDSGGPALAAKLARIAVIVCAALVLLWVSLGITLNFTVASRDPGAVLGVWPWSAQAKATLATAMVTPENDAETVLRGQVLLREAMRREPVNMDAARSLALSYGTQGNTERANLLFAHAERLSRRDLSTELWAIETAAGREDTQTALRHYDHALRTSHNAPKVLIPILTKAASDPEVAVPLGDILAKRPNWWPTFMEAAVKDTKDPEMLAAIARKLKLDTGVEIEFQFAKSVLARLISGERYGPALAFYRSLNTGTPGGEFLRDGDFAQHRQIPPLGWTFRDDANLSASVEIGATDKPILRIQASGGRGGSAAWQMLLLKPGRYRFAAEAGDTVASEASRPSVEITCQSNAGEVFDVTFPAAKDKPVGFGGTFTVPQGCPTQQLVIRAAPATETDSWIANLKIAPAA